TYPVTTNALKLELLINAAQIQLPRQVVQLHKGEHKKPPFLALNPLGKIPVLDDDGQIYSESNALLIHLARRFNSPLWPSALEQQSQVLQWLFWQATVWGPVANDFHHQHMLLPAWGLAPNTQRLQQQLPKFLDACAQLNAHLLPLKTEPQQQTPKLFLVGQTLSIADLSIAAFLLFWQESELPLENFPALLQWLEQLQQLPWWQQSKLQAEHFLSQIHAYA
ncbi:MAG: glutathione S-transferase family protein, partial [Motiliproteus sp.]